MGRIRPDQIEAFAATLWDARAAKQTLVPAVVESRIGGPLDLDDAYRIGAAMLRRRFERGETPIGWKLGYTSPAMREQMGVDQPNYGRLTDAMVIPDGGSIPDSALQPRAEPEIAVRLRRDLTTVPTSPNDVLEALDDAFACLEVVDSAWTDYRFQIEHNTADGSSAAFVVFGPSISRHDLTSTTVRLTRNGIAVATATGAAASGHPLAGVAWLAAELAHTGRVLRAGEVVITGGLTAAFPVEHGDQVEATFDGHITVSVQRRLT